MSDKLLITKKKSKSNKTFTIRIKEDIILKIQDISARTGYSQNELIEIFLGYALERCIVEE